ncbi:TonB-denpendent receptor [Sphingobium quisquiliarum P25]|uniref:TonB-denpendent receptor n=1 Tax=Sphingobium quisquiliarum P25 TaxID=1329909 RepID=T0H499_9SPHN|nr:TonB-dependent receptor [Sphingobium quisquiliarum]EQB11196.1 TonB-denpendent receptor [Sphingobium quisquiliarum P25]
MSNMKSAPSFLALSCVGALAFASAAHGQETAQSPKLGGMTVTDTAIDESEVKVERAESPKYVRPLLDTPQTITVIGNQTISKQNLLTLRDVLSTVPGITFGAGEGGGGYGDNINLRGQSANTDISIDGVRDSAQYSRTDPFNLEQIEVTNGANSVFGGSGAIGGNINLVTKRPKADDETLIQAGVGTSDYYRATIDSNMRLSDQIAVRLNAMYHENDVPARQVDHYKRWGVAPSVKLGVGGPTSLTLLYVHQEDNNVPLYGVPYYKNGVYDGLLPGVPYSGYFGYKNIDRQDQTIDQATAIFEHQFSDLLSVRNLSRWQRVEQDLVVDPPQGGTYCLSSGLTQAGVACAAGQVPGVYYPGGPRGNFRFSENQALYNQLDFTFNIPGGHTLVLGTSAMQEDYKLTSGNVLRNPGGAAPNPALNPIVIGVPTDYTGPVNVTPISRQRSDTFNIAAYAFAAVKIVEGLELNGGIRYEHNKATFRSDTITPPALPIPAGQTSRYLTGGRQVGVDDLFSYRVGLVYKPVENASLYIAYGNSKNPTSTTVRSGCGLAAAANLNIDPCDLSPEEARNYEIGGKIDLFDARLQLTAALFRNERTNYRVASNDPFVGNLPVGDGRNRVDGITLGASGNITKDWTIFANYTYLDSMVKQSISNYCLANPNSSFTPPGTTTALTCPAYDPQAGNPMTNTPKHSGSLFTTYTLPFGLQVGYGITYQGSFYLNNAQTTPTTIFYKSDAYTVHRAMLSYTFFEKLTAQLNVQNFTNKKYYTSIRNNGWANPGEGRSWTLTLGYKF